MAAQSLPHLPAILLTRPAEGAARFAQSLRAAFGAGCWIVISPLMAPAFLQTALPPGPFAALILTSETGAEAARRISAEGVALPHRAFCVGDRTAEVAAAAGFAAVSAQGEAATLVSLILQERPAGRLLHLHGEDSRGDIANSLSRRGIETLSAVVYAQRPQALTTEAQAVLAAPNPVILPLFSPRSARLFAALPRGAAPLWVTALSPAVAEAARALGPARLVVASQPDAGHLLKSLAGLIDAGGNP